MNNEKDIQLIEDYLDGLLKGKELEAFRQRLETDKAFAREFELRKKLAVLWKDAGEYRQTKDHVGEIIQQENRFVFYRSRKNYYLIAIAASVVLLLGIYFLVFRQGSHLPGSPKDQMAKAEDTLYFQEDKPEKLAKIAYHIQPVSPVNDQYFNTEDTLVFRWKAPADTAKVRFAILDELNHKTVYFTSVSLSDSILTLYPGMLPPGKYTWYLHDTLTLNHFSIK